MWHQHLDLVGASVGSKLAARVHLVYIRVHLQALADRVLEENAKLVQLDVASEKKYWKIALLVHTIDMKLGNDLLNVERLLLEKYILSGQATNSLTFY